MSEIESQSSPRTVIVGATTNESRYAHMAATRLRGHNVEFVPLGIKKGEVFGKDILDITEKPLIEDVDTLTLYVGPKNLQGYEDYLLDLNPRRIIFNPGSENQLLASKASEKGVEVVYGCTLVMLGSNTY